MTAITTTTQKKNFASIKTDREENNYFNVYRVPYKENATAPSDPKFLPFNDLDDQRETVCVGMQTSTSA